MTARSSPMASGRPVIVSPLLPTIRTMLLDPLRNRFDRKLEPTLASSNGLITKTARNAFRSTQLRELDRFATSSRPVRNIAYGSLVDTTPQRRTRTGVRGPLSRFASEARRGALWTSPWDV